MSRSTSDVIRLDPELIRMYLHCSQSRQCTWYECIANEKKKGRKKEVQRIKEISFPIFWFPYFFQIGVQYDTLSNKNCFTSSHRLRHLLISWFAVCWISDLTYPKFLKLIDFHVNFEKTTILELLFLLRHKMTIILMRIFKKKRNNKIENAS